MKRHFSGCEVADLAVQAEISGRKFLTELAKKARDKETSEALEFLAREEKEHEDSFRKLFGERCEHDPEEAYGEEYYAYLKSLASSFLFADKEAAEKAAASVVSFEEGLDIGIRLEKDSILFYSELLDGLSDSSRAVVERIIDEEKRHLNKLAEMKGA